MSRALFYGLCAMALALGLAFRLTGLDARPMHHDEANQALKFGALLEEGHYRYDRSDHHGPTLYYLTLPSAWLRGQATLTGLDERTLRIVPAVFGAALIPLFLLLERRLGRPAVAAAALLAAVSPALTYYSRFYIQESLFVFFTVGFLVALGRYAERPAAATALWAGLFAGLAYATKETSVVVVSAGLAACMVARLWSASAGAEGRPLFTHFALGAGAALAVAFLFYSSFLANARGLTDSILAFSVYLQRGVETARHAQPWDYYVRLLAWSSSGGLAWTEAFILALAVVGTARAFRTRSPDLFWGRFIALYSCISLLVFSALRYKTPWNVLPFHAGFVLMAGVGLAAIGGWPLAATMPVGQPFGIAATLRRHGGQGFSLAGPRAALAVVLLVGGAAHLGTQSWLASFRYAADPRNPYVYAHTSPDFLRLIDRMERLSAVHPDGLRMLVRVFAGPYEQWPLPWYLRRMTRVGYWPHAAEADSREAPVVIASQDNAAAIEASLGDRYVSEFYGLRPGVLLTLYVERGLWQRFLEDRK